VNIYGIIVLSALLIEYVLVTTADILSVRSMKLNLPDEFRGVCDYVTYKTSQDYTKARTSFSIKENSFFLVVLLLWWFLGGFPKLDNAVSRWTEIPLIRGLLFIGILMLLRAIIDLPFRIYSTFMIEERFGFNKTTPRVFASDFLKTSILAIIIGIPLVLGVLAFFEYTGGYAWIYCWILGTLVVISLQYLAPAWIMPLFNKFTPLEEGELRNALLAYAGSVQFQFRDIYVIDGSKRSVKTNAYFTGFGKNKRIALFDTLLEKYTPDELVTILAHEIGHYKRRHITQGIIFSVIHMGIMFFIMSFFIREKELFNAFFMTNVSVYGGLVLFGLLYSPLELFVSILLNFISRLHEYSADEFAARTIGKPEKFIDVLKKLHVENLSNLQPHPFQIILKYSHPPVLDRIKRIRERAELLRS
jgi:STE24 endopeptidase